MLTGNEGGCPHAILELRDAYVGECGFLPLVGGEIPVAGSGFMVVSAGAVGDSWIAPVVHPHLQQGSGRNLGADCNGAACELSGWQRCSMRWTPEVPYTVGALAD